MISEHCKVEKGKVPGEAYLPASRCELLAVPLGPGPRRKGAPAPSPKANSTRLPPQGKAPSPKPEVLPTAVQVTRENTQTPRESPPSSAAAFRPPGGPRSCVRPHTQPQISTPCSQPAGSARPLAPLGGGSGPPWACRATTPPQATAEAHWPCTGTTSASLAFPHPHRDHSPRPEPSPGSAGLRSTLHSKQPPHPRTHMLRPEFPVPLRASAQSPLAKHVPLTRSSHLIGSPAKRASPVLASSLYWGSVPKGC